MPATALDRLKRMTAWASEPTLSSDDLELLLDQFSTQDVNGVSPGGVDWIPTYNLRSAAAEGWRWKAAKASELQSTDLDGDRMSANQIFDHCQKMIKTYSTTASFSVGQGT